MQSRVQTLEQALLSGEGGAIEEQITLTLVKKGIVPILGISKKIFIWLRFFTPRFCEFGQILGTP